MRSIIYSQNGEHVPKPVLTANSFNQLVLEAIDESLLELGNVSKDTIYSYLNSKPGSIEGNMFIQTESLISVLHRVFGKAAVPLEKMIAIHLYNKLQSNMPRFSLDSY
jgi:hypothetical protein